VKLYFPGIFIYILVTPLYILYISEKNGVNETKTVITSSDNNIHYIYYVCSNLHFRRSKVT